MKNLFKDITESLLYLGLSEDNVETFKSVFLDLVEDHVEEIQEYINKI